MHVESQSLLAWICNKTYFSCSGISTKQIHVPAGTKLKHKSVKQMFKFMYSV